MFYPQTGTQTNNSPDKYANRGDQMNTQGPPQSGVTRSAASGPGEPAGVDAYNNGSYNGAYGGTHEMTATMEGLAAYAGQFGAKYAGDRTLLPPRIVAHTANQIPLPTGMSLATFMQKFGYTPDADGNWIKRNPVVNQGYGGGGSYNTQTQFSAAYNPYGYGGGYRGGYSSGGGGGGGGSQPGGAKMGLVQWRIGA